MKYRREKDGDWVWPVMEKYRLMCCDCGLVHDVEFVVTEVDGKPAVAFRARRNNRATAASRRKRAVVRTPRAAG